MLTQLPLFLFTYLYFGLIDTYDINNINLHSQQHYNYYLLSAQKWCGDRWQIHGLWPQTTPHLYPTYCEVVIYNPPNNFLLNEMNTCWDTCNKNKTELWEHEWIKHGSCVKHQMGINEYEYFGIAIDMFESSKWKLQNCSGNQCILGCFNLDYEMILCPQF